MPEATAAGGTTTGRIKELASQLTGSEARGQAVTASVYENRNTIAAASASIVSTIAGFPLDSVKSRLQVKRYSSILDCVSRTYADEGMRGFFRGVYIPLVTISVVRTASFTIYSKTKESLIRRDLLSPANLTGTAALGLAGGGLSGMLLSCGTSSFEFAKISQQLDYLISVQRGIPYEPKGTIRGFLDIYRTGGVAALYTGFPLHFARDCIGTALYFSLYDSARFIVNKHGASSPVEIPRFVSTFICGSGAGILSWVVIYPLDLAKANLQRNALALAPYESPWHIFRRLADGGVTKLYRGLGVSAIRSIASHGLMWTVLEAVRGHIEHDTGMVGRD